ncbi:hypothetical protein CP532_0490, partial [Ophiocordyceps camponoti-leonardi (nom. inval.)]
HSEHTHFNIVHMLHVLPASLRLHLHLRLQLHLQLSVHVTEASWVGRRRLRPHDMYRFVVVLDRGRRRRV